MTPAEPQDRATRPRPGQAAVLGAALSVGVLMLAIQLWLLTVALDLYLGGTRLGLSRLASLSGLVFAGGLFVLRVLRRRPSIGGTAG